MAKTFFDDSLEFDISVFDGYDDSNDEQQFNLYLMTRQIKQATSSLKQVMLLPDTQREIWVKQNRAVLSQLMDGLVSDVMEVFEEMEADRIVLEESIACVTELRELINTLNSLTHNHSLRS